MIERLADKFSYTAIAIFTAIVNWVIGGVLLGVMFSSTKEVLLKWTDNIIYVFVSVCILMVILQVISFVTSSRAKEFDERYYKIGIVLSFISLLGVTMTIIIAFDIFR